MPIPLRFAMRSASDHSTPWAAAPAVLLWSPGAPTWRAPYGAVTTSGNGWWSVAADPRDQAGGSPLLLYATADGADPTPAAYYPDAATWTQGATTLPMPFWLGTSASEGYLPHVDGGVSVLVSASGAAESPAAGTVTEPGVGFYLYWPAAADVAQPGDLALYTTAPGADPATWDYPIAAAVSAGATDGRERDIRAAIKARLLATGAFDAVMLGRLPEGYGAGASELAAAAVLPASSRRRAGWDAAPGGARVYDCHIRLVILARHQDPELLDDRAEQLANLACNAIDGQPLVPGLTCPQQTEVVARGWQDTPMPERRVALEVSAPYLAPAWGTLSTAQ